jgi:hypothetical protein
MLWQARHSTGFPRRNGMLHAIVQRRDSGPGDDIAHDEGKSGARLQSTVDPTNQMMV